MKNLSEEEKALLSKVRGFTIISYSTGTSKSYVWRVVHGFRKMKGAKAKLIIKKARDLLQFIGKN